MAIRHILNFPHDEKRLRRVAQPIAEITDDIRMLAADMLETMYDDGGVGLAAIQIGVEHRMVVMDLSPDHSQPRVLINPEIIERTGEVAVEEGCLSVRGCFAEVKRAAYVKFTAQDLHGKIETYEAHAPDLLCNCIQHEVDHLNGILFIDHLSSLKRERITKKLKKLQDIQL